MSCDWETKKIGYLLMLSRAVKENNQGSCYFYSWISLYLYVFSTKLDLHECLRNYASISSSIKIRKEWKRLRLSVPHGTHTFVPNEM